jgi:hypothetical protein
VAISETASLTVQEYINRLERSRSYAMSVIANRKGYIKALDEAINLLKAVSPS